MSPYRSLGTSLSSHLAASVLHLRHLSLRSAREDGERDPEDVVVLSLIVPAE